MTHDSPMDRSSSVSALAGSPRALYAVDLDIRDSAGRCLVHGVSFDVERGSCLGVVGESGSGKTLSLRACLGILPAGVCCTARQREVAGVEIDSLTGADLGNLLGTQVGYVPQNMMEYLHPMMRISSQVVDGYLTHHHGVRKVQAFARARELMSEMGIEDPERVLASYPTQLSGGMLQRVKMAIALMGEPAVIVADEPTAALDVVTQLQVSSLLVQACRQHNVAMVMVTHSLGLVRRCCDRVVVMHAGHVVECGTCAQVLDNPRHPYTKALLKAQPQITHADNAGQRLYEIPGSMPETGRESDECLFAERCALRQQQCVGPLVMQVRDGHAVACARAWEGA